MVTGGDLGGSAVKAMSAAGLTDVSFEESEFERPFLRVPTRTGSNLEIQLWLEDGGFPCLRLEALLLPGLDDAGEGSEFVLRVLNGMNRLEGTPWKLWLKGMKVEFEGVLVDDPIGEVWATWSIPAELVSVDDLPGLCRRFSERLGAVEIPGLTEALETFLP